MSEETLEEIARLVRAGEIKTKKELAAILYHEFAHWAYSHDYELFWKLEELT